MIQVFPTKQAFEGLTIKTDFLKLGQLKKKYIHIKTAVVPYAV